MMRNIFMITLLLIATHCGYAAEISISLYYITKPDVFTGSGGLTSECFITNQGPLIGCSGTMMSTMPRLTDGVTGLGEDPPINTDQFIGWDNSGNETFTLAARLNESGFVKQFDIYFYNNPAMEVGLPDVSLVEVSQISPFVNIIGPLLFTYGSNHLLTGHDQNVTMISVIITTNYKEDHIPEYDFVLVTFNFSSQLIRQALVSEIKIYDKPVNNGTSTNIIFQPGPDKIELDTSLDSMLLSCTVENEGLFLWRWTGPNQAALDPSRTSILTADLTRTSILRLTNLSLSDAGEYTCMVQMTLTNGSKIEGSTSVMLNAVLPSSSTSLTSVRSTVLPETNVENHVNLIISCGLIVAAVVILLIVQLSILCIKHCKKRHVLYTENSSHVYATIHKKHIPFAASISHSSITTYDNGKQEIKPDWSPQLFHSQIELQQQTNHENHTGIDTDHTFGITSLTDDLQHICAELRSPPIPPFHGTPSTSEVRLYDEDLNPEMFKDLSSLSIAEEGDTLFPITSIYAEISPIEEPNDILNIKEANIREIGELGVGRFGKISLVRTVGVPLNKLRSSTLNKNYNILAVVKWLTPNADEEIKDAFEKEVKFMSRLQHKNVIKLLGVCRSTNTFMMMEYVDGGDLNGFLQGMELALSLSSPLTDNSVTLSTLMNITLQVANGMRYLANLNYVHRDLAARNCLVCQGGDITIKIGEFGMSRNLYQSHYYLIKGKAMLPIRWMARECFYGHFSEKSDIWAFGVTMWEIFTLCRIQLYEELTDEEVIDNATESSDPPFLSQPDHCPDRVYQLMKKCWIANVDKRIRFSEVHAQLSLISEDCS